MRQFFIALQFLTRIPSPRLQDITEEEAGRSLIFYPLVGLVIGIILASIGWLLTDTNHNLQAAVVLIVWIIITGGLHLDGLADSADAWLGGHGDRERTLEIMKDAACGPAGAIALIVALLIKYNTLLILGEQNNWLILAITPILARAAVLLLFQTTEYVRPGGLGEALARHYSYRRGTALLVCLALGLIMLLGYTGLIFIFIMLSVVLLMRWLMIKRIGGTTGDTAGAVVEVVEISILLAATSV